MNDAPIAATLNQSRRENGTVVFGGNDFSANIFIGKGGDRRIDQTLPVGRARGRGPAPRPLTICSQMLVVRTWFFSSFKEKRHKKSHQHGFQGGKNTRAPRNPRPGLRGGHTPPQHPGAAPPRATLFCSSQGNAVSSRSFQRRRNGGQRTPCDPTLQR